MTNRVLPQSLCSRSERAFDRRDYSSGAGWFGFVECFRWRGTLSFSIIAPIMLMALLILPAGAVVAPDGIYHSGTRQ
jgi:hypothetical protein